MRRDLTQKQIEIDTRNNVIKEMDGRLNKVLAEKSGLEARLHEKSDSISRLTPQQDTAYLQAVQSELSQAMLELTTIKQENMALKHKVESTQSGSSLVQKLQLENADLKQKAESIGKQLLSQMSNKSTTSVEFEKLKLDNSFLKQNLDALKTQIGTLNSINQALRIELEATKEFIIRKEGQQNEELKLKSELSNTKASLENAKDEVVDMARKANSASVKLEQVQRENSDLKEEIDVLRKRTIGSSRNIQAATQEKDQLKIQLTMLREEVIEAKLKAENLESKLQANEKEFSTMTSENELLKFQQEKNQSELESLKNQLELATSSIRHQSDAIESEKHHARVVANLEEQVDLHKEAEAKVTRDINLLTKENKELLAELRRISGLLEAASKSQHGALDGQKYSISGIKQLEDQVLSMEVEIRKLKEEKNLLTMDSDRLKTSEVKNREIRAELDMSRHRMEYLEAELNRKREEVDAAKEDGHGMVQKLRDEIRQLRENEGRERPINISNPQMSPLVNPRSNLKLSADAIEEKQVKDKLYLEIGLAKAEKQIKDKDAKIIGLESKIGDLKRDIEKQRLLSTNTQADRLEETLKRENLQLMERINTLEAQEHQLRENESNKDKIIAQLQSAFKDQVLNTSSKHE